MGYAVERHIFGKKYWVGVPLGESIMHGDGTHFTCWVWPDRLSECRVNGVAVSEIKYRMAKRGNRLPKPLTPAGLRFRLRCYVHPLGAT